MPNGASAVDGRRLRNVKGKGEDGGDGDGDGRVKSEEAMPPNPHPQQYLRIIPFWNSPPKYLRLFHFGIVRPHKIICLILHT